MKHTICLMNDSFPPQFDGVANTTVNYADVIERNHGHSVVVTPDFPDKQDYKYNFPIVRYPSLDARWFIGFMAGVPFSPTVMKRLREEKIELMHCHCPAAALFLARQLRVPMHVPVVMTYHTKYDVDLLKAFKLKLLSENVVKIMINNISSCDEVWTVSRGAGENLRSLGYKGEYRVMENGVDMKKQRAGAQAVRNVTEGYDLPEGVPVFLFVGRMMWYKGIKLLLDAAARLKEKNFDFRMVLIGNGADFEEILLYAKAHNLIDKVLFTGAIYDRDAIKAWYTAANAFMFPSTYDTNGLVVREAASASLPSILVGGSCAAEGAEDGRNAFLIEENAEALAEKLYEVGSNFDLMRRVGCAAADELYISWDEAVAKAYERYEVIIDNYRCGKYPKRRKISDKLLKGQGELMRALSNIPYDDYF